MEKKEYKEPSIRVVMLGNTGMLLADSDTPEEKEQESEEIDNVIKTLSDELWTR